MNDSIIHGEDGHVSSSESLFCHDPQFTSPHLDRETLILQHSDGNDCSYHRGHHGDDAIMMSPPTMHPNLVMTLKSILLASPESIDSSSSFAAIPDLPMSHLSPNPRGKVVCDASYGDKCIARKKLHMTEVSLGYGDRNLHTKNRSDDVGDFGYGENGDTGKLNRKKGNDGDVGDFGYGKKTAPKKLKKMKKRNDDDDDDDDDDDELIEVVPLDLIRNKRPFTCSYEGCLKTFKNPQTLRMHTKTHSKGTPRLLRASMTLTTGTRTPPDNTNAGPSSTHTALPAPDVQFSMSSMSTDLGSSPIHSTSSRATTAHRNRKKVPSRCPLCMESFVGLYELRRHFGRKHSQGEKQHACRKCCKRFYVEVDLRDHEKLCGVPVSCQCGMKFAFKCNLISHKRAHPECQDHVPDVHSSHSTPTSHSTRDYHSCHLATSFSPSNMLLFPPPQFDAQFEPMFDYENVE